MVFEATKRSTPESEREWKTEPENGVFSCVPFCLRSLGRFARCVALLLSAQAKVIRRPQLAVRNSDFMLLSNNEIIL